MVGLGCGARSYTYTHHYSSEYAVGAKGIRAILQHYITTPDKAFAFAHYGFILNEEEQRRRYVLKSLLEADGLNLHAYQRRFASDAFTDLPQLHELQRTGMVNCEHNMLRLSESGVEYSDAIGPWLYSEQVRQLIGGYVLR